MLVCAYPHASTLVPMLVCAWHYMRQCAYAHIHIVVHLYYSTHVPLSRVDSGINRPLARTWGILNRPLARTEAPLNRYPARTLAQHDPREILCERGLNA